MHRYFSVMLAIVFAAALTGFALASNGPTIAKIPTVIEITAMGPLSLIAIKP